MNIQVGVKLIIKNNKNEYLFLRRTYLTGENGLGWDIPGGRIRPNETLDEALAREVYEETRLKVTKTNLVKAQDIFVTQKNIHVVRLTYIGETEDEMVELSEEHAEYRWMTSDQALAEPIDSCVQEVMKNL